MHRTKGTFYFVAYLTYRNVDTLLPFRNFMSSCHLRENADLEVCILWRSWEGDDVSNILHTGDK